MKSQFHQKEEFIGLGQKRLHPGQKVPAFIPVALRATKHGSQGSLHIAVSCDQKMESTSDSG